MKSLICLLVLSVYYYYWQSCYFMIITSIGQPGLECHFSHDNNSISVPVLQLQFVENKVWQCDHTY